MIRPVATFGPTCEPLIISPDGRWAATFDASSLVVVDLDSSEEASFPRGRLNGFEFEGIVFAETTAFGGNG